MGGKSSGPDYGQLAMQQGENNAQVNRDQTYANRPDQYTPWGYTDWTNREVIDPSTGESTTEWSQTQGLTPELQNILNQQIAIQGGRSDIAGMLTGRLGNEYGQGMDWSNMSPMGGVPTSQFTAPEGGVGDPYATRAAAENAVWNQANSRLDPKFESQSAALESKMRNQGLRPQDAAWQSQVQGMGQQQNDARNQALWSANDAGRQESGQMFGQQLGRDQNTFNQSLQSNAQNYGQAMQGSQYANQIRQQQMTEAMTQRGYGLNEINALLSGQQVGMPQMPNFSQANAAAPPPTYQAGVDQGNYDAASNPMNGLMGIVGQGVGGYAGRG
jgi:hypothetical protein